MKILLNLDGAQKQKSQTGLKNLPGTNERFAVPPMFRKNFCTLPIRDANRGSDIAFQITAEIPLKPTRRCRRSVQSSGATFQTSRTKTHTSRFLSLHWKAYTPPRQSLFILCFYQFTTKSFKNQQQLKFFIKALCPVPPDILRYIAAKGANLPHLPFRCGKRPPPVH